MATEGGYNAAFAKQGALGIVLCIIGVFGLLGFAYMLFFGGDKNVAEFQHACWDREMLGRSGADSSEAARLYIVRKCDRELSEYLERRRR